MIVEEIHEILIDVQLYARIEHRLIDEISAYQLYVFFQELRHCGFRIQLFCLKKPEYVEYRFQLVYFFLYLLLPAFMLFFRMPAHIRSMPEYPFQKI